MNPPVLQMTIDGVRAVRNRCQRCNMRGYCRPATQVTPADVSSLEDTSDSLRERFVCVTCFDTPSGCHSPNETHRRLPEAEYLVTE